MTQLIYNFSAGPAMLPAEVLAEAEQALTNWQNTGLSILEIGHRTQPFLDMIDECEADLRRLMQIPDNYHVFFMQGGATLQFSMIPLNFLADNATADYIETGFWSKKAIDEARKYGHVNIAAATHINNGVTELPAVEKWSCTKNAAYIHYTANETIQGIAIHHCPNDAPLVADLSSNIVSEPLDVSRFALIYASAQKNMGIAGLTCVVIRDNFLQQQVKRVFPALLDYQYHLKCAPMAQTPPVFAWYMTHRVLKWIERQGGIAAIAQKNAQKAQLLYAAIDNSDFYVNTIAPACRSVMNVPFQLRQTELDKTFLKEAQAAGLKQLAGHRWQGGMRASLYNAMPLKGVQALVEFMQDFEQRYG